MRNEICCLLDACLVVRFFITMPIPAVFGRPFSMPSRNIRASRSSGAGGHHWRCGARCNPQSPRCIRRASQNRSGSAARSPWCLSLTDPGNQIMWTGYNRLTSAVIGLESFEKNPPTAFIHEAEVGVTWACQCLQRSSQFLTFSLLCVA